MDFSNKFKKRKNKNQKIAMDFAEIFESVCVDNNTIFYECRDGKSMTDSPFALFHFFITDDKYSHLTHVWSVDNSVDEWKLIKEIYNDYTNVIFVERNSWEYLNYLSSAKYLINNSTFQSFFIPKEEQICINTWHGTPLKKMGYDINEGNPAGLQNVVRNLFFSDYLISPNEHTTNMYMKSFKLDNAFSGEIIETGYPRMDCMHSSDKEVIIKKLKDNEVIIEEKKQIILYCPTWKGTNVNKPEDGLSQIIAEMDYLREKVSAKYNLLVKVHPFLYSFAKYNTELKKYLVPDSFDPNEIMSCIDILVTDYSSIFFDFLKTNKPIIFYCWDKEEYEDGRGLSLSEEVLPGPIVSTIEKVAELIPNIKEINSEYNERYNKLKEKFLPYEDGKSSKRIIEYIFEKKSLDKGKIIRCEDEKKKKILIYTGGLKNNGITSSFINLMKNIDFDKYDVTCFSGYPKTKEQIQNINLVPDKARFIYKPGYALLTKKENKLLNKFNSECNAKTTKVIPWKGLAREAKRVFSNRKFDFAIDFSGYSFFWAKYIITVDAMKKICFLHSDMMADKDRLVNGKKIHEKNLLPLFYNYDQFHQLLTVSPTMKKINQDNLNSFVSEEKIDYTLNTLNLEKIFLKQKISSKTSYKISAIKQEVRLADEDNSLKIYENWNDKEYNREIIPKGHDNLKAVSEVKSFDINREKILFNDVFIGWANSSDLIKKFPSLQLLEEINEYGYIKNNKNTKIWIDLPIKSDARFVAKASEYKFLFVKAERKAILTNGKIYFRIKFKEEEIGWLESTKFSISNNGITFRRFKNGLTNKNMLKRWSKRTLETCFETGSAKIDINFLSEHQDTNYFNLSNEFDTRMLENTLFHYKKKVRNDLGWYYKLWDKGQLIGWFHERCLSITHQQVIIEERKVTGYVRLKEKYYYDTIELLVKKEASLYNYDIETVLETTLGKLFKTSNGKYINEDNIYDFVDQTLKDITGRIIDQPSSKNYNVVTMGRLSSEKRQNDLIKSFGEFKKNASDTKLYILGNGPLKNNLLQTIHNLKLENDVFLLGYLDNPFEFMKKCQLFILTSAYEGQPMVLLEAMSINLPVATTDIPATKFVLQNGKLGKIAEENSINGITNLLKNAYFEKISPANFDPYKYNEEAIRMFYNKIEGE